LSGSDKERWVPPTFPALSLPHPETIASGVPGR
jgi:hypothetical protein